MTRRVVFVVTAVLLLASISGGVSAAEEGTKQVAVVISFPDGTEHTEVVTVPTSATMLDVIKATKVDLVSTNSDFGPAVCAINKVGCPAENCFCDKDHFWAYYHLDPATSKWQASAHGVGGYMPASGAVEGLVWSGLDASFMPTDQPQVHTFQELSGGAPQTLPATGSGALPLAIALGLSLIAAGMAGRAASRRRSGEDSRRAVEP